MAIVKKATSQNSKENQDRTRDSKGRFLSNKEQLSLRLDRDIKAIKLKNSYGTYQIKEVEEIDKFIYVAVGIVLITLFLK